MSNGLEQYKNRIILGDSLDVLKTLPDECVQMCVTSPPYWQQRDYKAKGQIGLEKNPRVYIEKLKTVFTEIKRVLRSDGTLWLNIGDKYLSAKGTAKNPGGRIGPNACIHSSHKEAGVLPLWRPNISEAREIGIKHKDLVGIPWMIAFAMRDDGWYLRSEIIWSKPHCLPENVPDRPTRSHEHIFLFSKSQRYFYNLDAIREPVKPGNNGNIRHRERLTSAPFGERDKDTRQREVSYEVIKGANKRSIWTIPLNPTSESHFATFPPDLIKPCILAGSKQGDTVLDPFMGAGTTGVVAQNLGRNWIGIELNPEYVEMAYSRIKRETSQKLLFTGDFNNANASKTYRQQDMSRVRERI